MSLWKINLYTLSINNSFYKLNGFDIVLILSLISASLFIFLFTEFGINWRINKNDASIFANGKFLMRLNLNEDKKVPLLDGKMLIEIKKGQIRVAESNCPKKICVHSGWIKMPGQIIVCLPNKILIQINSTGKSSLDAVAN